MASNRRRYFTAAELNTLISAAHKGRYGHRDVRERSERIDQLTAQIDQLRQQNRQLGFGFREGP